MMDWDDEPLVKAANESETEAMESAPVRLPRRRYRWEFSLFDLNRLVLLLMELAALTGLILGDIWLWGRV